MNLNIDNKTKQTARLAGFFYAIALFAAGFAYFAREKLINLSDATATSQNITSSESLFRLSLFSDLVMTGAYFFLAILMYQIFKVINKKISLLMLGLIIIGLPVMFISMFSHIVVLELLSGGSYLDVLTMEQVNALTLLFLHIVEGGGFLLTAFIGPWLLPLGYLVKVSGYFPKYFGELLMVSGAIYIAALCTSLLSSNYLNIFTPTVFIVPGLIEIAFALWLLIKGANVESKN